MRHDQNLDPLKVLHTKICASAPPPPPPVNKDTRQGAAGGEECEKDKNVKKTDRLKEKETQKGGDLCTVEALFVFFPLSALSFCSVSALAPQPEIHTCDFTPKVVMKANQT